MTRLHVRAHSRHSAGGPAVWVFLSVVGLFLTAIFVIAWMLYQLLVLALDLATSVLQLAGA